MWYGRYPNSTEQFAGLQYWVENGSSGKTPAVNSAVVEVCEIFPYLMENLTRLYVIYMDCELDEGVTSEQVYNAYYSYAKLPRKLVTTREERLCFLYRR